jgi:triosephosphate isomerase
MRPLIVVNFKLYPEAVGQKSLELAKKLERAKNGKCELIIAPSLLTLKEVAEQSKLNVFAPHADSVRLGAHTGMIAAEELKLVGAEGVLLNHSEHKISVTRIRETIKECRKNKLKVLVCASTLSEIKRIAAEKPDYIAYEPKELIGTDVSVTVAHPKILQEGVRVVKKISPRTKVLCGAGIHSGKDFRQALLLGAEGVLLAHAAVKAKNAEMFLRTFLKEMTE